MRRKTVPPEARFAKGDNSRLPAFTLIELLVVIMIIGILIAAGTVYYAKSQQKVRDARRKSDLKTIQVALDQYYQKNGKFPAHFFGGVPPPPYGSIRCNLSSPSDTNTILWGSAFTCGGITYLNETPKDPLSPIQNYYLNSSPLTSTSPQTYTLNAILENTNDPDLAGLPCSLTSGYNYCVTIP